MSEPAGYGPPPDPRNGPGPDRGHDPGHEFGHELPWPGGPIGPRHDSGERRTSERRGPVPLPVAAESGSSGERSRRRGEERRGGDHGTGRNTARNTRNTARDTGRGERRRGRGNPGRPAAPRTPLQTLVAGVTELVVVLAMALTLSLIIKTFLVQAFYIPSPSMENSLLVGDRVVVSKLTPGPLDLHHGDVVVFKDPGTWLPAVEDPGDGGLRRALRTTLTFVGLLPQDSGEHLIKRVIGLPGDTVVCCDAQKRLTVNGVALDETYLYPNDEPSLQTFTVTVPKDSLWVMGDHRSVSKDSRLNPQAPFVPVSNVVGKAFVVVWPLGHAGGVAGPGETFARVPEKD